MFTASDVLVVLKLSAIWAGALVWLYFSFVAIEKTVDEETGKPLPGATLAYSMVSVAIGWILFQILFA